MATLKYSKRFDWMVMNGMKRQTIRDNLKKIEPGTKLTHMVGNKIIFRSICRNVVEIQIFDDHVLLNHPVRGWTSKLEGPNTLDAFARKDGFADWREMRNWFQAETGLPASYAQPFKGWVIVW